MESREQLVAFDVFSLTCQSGMVRFAPWMTVHLMIYTHIQTFIPKNRNACLLDMFNIYRSGYQVHTFYYLDPHTGIYIIIGIQHKARRSFRATCMPIISFFDPSH